MHGCSTVHLITWSCTVNKRLTCHEEKKCVAWSEACRLPALEVLIDCLPADGCAVVVCNTPCRILLLRTSCLLTASTQSSASASDSHTNTISSMFVLFTSWSGTRKSTQSTRKPCCLCTDLHSSNLIVFFEGVHYRFEQYCNYCISVGPFQKQATEDLSRYSKYSVL